MTHKRAVILVIAIWISSALLSLVNLLVPMNIAYLVLAITGILCLVTSGLLFLRWPNTVFACAFADAIFNTCTRISQTCRQ